VRILGDVDCCELNVERYLGLTTCLFSYASSNVDERSVINLLSERES